MLCFPYFTIFDTFFSMIFPEFAIYFPACGFSSVFRFAWLCTDTKNLKKADGKKAVFLRKIYKKKNRKFVMMKEEECTLKHLTKSGTERFWEYTIRSGGGFFMIRENNTLDMARDSRTKKNDTKKDNTKKRKSTETKKKGVANPRAAIAASAVS